MEGIYCVTDSEPTTALGIYAKALAIAMAESPAIAEAFVVAPTEDVLDPVVEESLPDDEAGSIAREKLAELRDLFAAASE